MRPRKHKRMMNSVEYLQKELKVIADNFPNVNIRYGFDDVIKTHIVELLPLVEYDTNESLENAWIPLSISFLENYMDEEIAFISSGSTLSIKKILLEFNPLAFKEKNIISEVYSALTYSHVNYNFPSVMPNGIVSAKEVINIINSPVEKPEKDDCLDYSYLYPIAA
jgi:hypothetical protein